MQNAKGKVQNAKVQIRKKAMRNSNAKWKNQIGD